jgi:lipoate-protein ligase B
MKKCTVFKLGQVNYDEALSFQFELVEKVKDKKGKESFLILLEHEPVITLGKNGNKNNILITEETMKKKGIIVRRIDRGGDVTYHGPGQLVGYPIISLAYYKTALRDYVHTLEQCMIDTLADFGIKATRDDKYVGAWVNNEKIGFIGIRITKGITYHGFSLNVNNDLDTFKLINPCGMQDRKITSLEKLLGKKAPSVSDVTKEYIKHFSSSFDLTSVSVKTHLSYIPRDNT